MNYKADITNYVEGSTIPSYICDTELLKLRLITDYNTYMITSALKSLRLLSKTIYGDESYSWLLGYLNGITDDDVLPGVLIRYPGVQVLESIKYIK